MKAQDRTFTAGMYESLLERHHALEHEVLQVRQTVENQRDYYELVRKVSEQAKELRELNHRMARSLPPKYGTGARCPRPGGDRGVGLTVDRLLAAIRAGHPTPTTV